MNGNMSFEDTWLMGSAEDGPHSENLCHRQLLRALPVAVYTCDSKGRVTFYNHAAVKLWGRAPDVDKDLWCGSLKLFYPDGTPMPRNEYPMARLLREGKATRGEELVIERPNGSRLCVQAYPAPIINDMGFLVAAVNTLVDLAGDDGSAE